ncbi:hypothetical protein GCM10008986_12810 [Salinibacillus aidingensis]|uniref:Uncharacterized protein n=1 Tax=Salinibacillus aidingensis TaxID=237684 RepID=A0ABP3KWJ9_9BACI
MNKKKLLWSILLVLLVGIVLYAYNLFNGNPLSQYVSRQVLEDYLTETYPEKEFRIKEGSYSFKFSEYVYPVTEIGTADKEGKARDYSFKVRGFLNPRVQWDGYYYEHLDQSLGKQLTRQAENELTTLLSSRIDSIKNVGVQIEVLKGTFKEDVTWSKSLNLEKPMDVFVQLDSTEQAKKDFYNAARKIERILNENGYEYTSVLFNGSGFDREGAKAETRGYLKYSVKIIKGEPIDGSDVEEHNQNLE